MAQIQSERVNKALETIYHPALRMPEIMYKETVHFKGSKARRV